MKRPAVFLDRDGTLIVDYGYMFSPHQVVLLPGVPEALLILQKMGFMLIVISNQSAVGRGLITSSEVAAVNQYLSQLLGRYGIELIDFYYCPHRPEENCSCRKPKPGLILRALDEYGIEASRSYFAGDKWTDVEAALAAGVKPVLLGPPEAVTICTGFLAQAPSLFAWAECLRNRVWCR